MGFNSQHVAYLCNTNDLTMIDLVALLVCYPLSVVIPFTALEIREDIILPSKENALRGVGLYWTRARCYWFLYIEFPLSYVSSVVFLLLCKGFHYISFADCSEDSWLYLGVKMILTAVVWEFIMYNMHRTWHAIPWLYKIAHKGHHVQMDFPLGPYAPLIEQVTAFVATICAGKITGLSVTSYLVLINILIAQCVIEHAYSSIHIPIWHDFFFSSADDHQIHHKNVNVNFSYAIDIFDNVFGTAAMPENDDKKITTIGPATAQRIQLLKRFKLMNKPQN